MLVGALKAVQCSAVVSSVSHCLVAEWLGLSVTVRVRARDREWGFPFLFFFSPMLEVINTFVLHVNSCCDVHGIRGVRTTPVCDVTMMYSKERYTENVPERKQNTAGTDKYS